MKESLSENTILRISKNFARVDKYFDEKKFIELSVSGLQHFELKGRVQHIITALKACLPNDFEQAATILSQLKTHWIRGDEEDSFQAFAAWPVIDCIAELGIEHPHTALPLLKDLTGLFSAEFAIRAFIMRYPDICQAYFLQWINDEDEHVRRLVSEGTRPRLPWAMQLKMYVNNPHCNIPLLAHLKNDSSLYVRRSVANHLNDIAKDHPELVIDICEQWTNGATPDVQWVIKHATRSLVKQGHSRVYPLLGYSQQPNIELPELIVTTPDLNLGDTLSFSVKLQSQLPKAVNQSEKFVVDYAIGFVKANGQQKLKVFKLKNVSLNKDQQITIDKKQVLKAISTRQYYSGVHQLVILINGVKMAEGVFNLSV
jgi:3-methyladenine DNA glycosylase AlkC